MRREFDELAQMPLRRLTVERASLAGIPALVSFATTAIPALAAAETAVARVQRKDPESVWAFRRGERVVGLYSMLMLNEVGLERLSADRLDFSYPDLDCLCAPGEPVRGIYKWAVVAPGTVAEGICAMSRHLQSERYARANLYARALGRAAERFDSNLGFRPVQPGSELLVYVRMRNRIGHDPIAA